MMLNGNRISLKFYLMKDKYLIMPKIMQINYT